MSFKVTLTDGICSLPMGGCVVTLQPNSSINFINTQKYFLLNGTANLSYNHEEYEKITSPYNDVWNSYVDNWIYNTPAHVITDPTTVFLQVGISANAVGVSTISTANVIAINNSNTGLLVKPNSTIVVVGNNYSIDNVAYTDIIKKMMCFSYDTEKTVYIESINMCTIVYLEAV